MDYKAIAETIQNCGEYGCDESCGWYSGDDGFKCERYKSFPLYEQFFKEVVEEKEKTCYKCKHYHACMEDVGTNYHFHDGCDFWKAVIPTRVDNYDGCFDDVDNEIAVCGGYDDK